MKIKTTKLILCSIILISFPLAGTVYGQTNSYTISGIVIDNHSQESLFYANVGLLNAQDSSSVYGVSTDGNGKFEISNVKAGDYLFQASYIGYDVYWQAISVTGEKKEISLDTIKLQSKPTTLQGVTIYEKKPVYTIDGEKTLYNVSEDPSIQTGTTSDALQNAPGVEVDIEGNITLRGVSSVEIWINDKPSRLNAENLKTYIQQLPANSLDRIEVITNPSARYSSTGTGGIINIITRSNIKRNSFISFGVSANTRPSVSPWISYMYANQKFTMNVYMYGYYSQNKSTSDGYNITFNENMDTSNHRKYTSGRESSSVSLGMYINGSYNFDTMKTISFWCGTYGNPYSKNHSFEDYYYYREFISDMGLYNYTEETNSKSSYMGGYAGVSYQHKFNNEGHKLSIDVDGNFWYYTHSSNYKRLYQLHTGRDIDKNSLSKNGNYSPSMDIDYSLPYSKTGEISIGIGGTYNPLIDYWKNDTLLSNTTDRYILDSMRYKDTYGTTGVFKSYITVQQKIKKFTIKGGLRVEYRNFNYEVRNAVEHNVSKDYTGLFPSLHLSYASEKMHNFTLSYSRRVSYPRASQLSTFIAYGDDSYSTGNNDLLPTYTNNIEGGWTKYFTKFGSVGLSAYFKNTKDEVANLTDVIYDNFFGRYVRFSMPVNSNKSHSYGLNANMMYKIKTFINIRLYANVYNSHSETVFRGETKVNTDNFVYSFRLNFWAKLWKVLEVNLSGNYRSKTASLFQIEQPVYSINGGLRADFWKRKISVYLNVQDIFDWNRSKNNTTNPYYIAYNSTKYKSRYISVGISFRFGKIEMENQAQMGRQMNTGGQME
ncbi:MAG: outer membrane beta-barrel protein [Bacteroidales bacterium]|jgi:outer membrane receptor protein involved in Fe transport|nr:outer membrane beta-barrel protein [Bacteroidales bacterium]